MDDAVTRLLATSLFGDFCAGPCILVGIEKRRQMRAWLPFPIVSDFQGSSID
jgi:hypothetical protein